MRVTDRRFSDILAAAKDGDVWARDELHRRYAPQILGHLRKRARNGLRRTHDTADLAQSVFVEVFRDLPRFEDRGEKAFRKWLSIKANNKVRMKFRKQLDRSGQRREQALGDARLDRPEPTPGPNTTLRMSEDVVRLRRAMTELRPEDRTILLLRQNGAKGYAELADFLGLGTPNAARKRHVRALLALKQAWDRL